MKPAVHVPWNQVLPRTLSDAAISGLAAADGSNVSITTSGRTVTLSGRIRT